MRINGTHTNGPTTMGCHSWRRSTYLNDTTFGGLETIEDSCSTFQLAVIWQNYEGY